LLGGPRGAPPVAERQWELASILRHNNRFLNRD
jgi:hypothetical protein